MQSAIIILFCLLAYLLGAVPTGLYLARIKGVDIREVGSGNIGATNVFRTAGKGVGILTLLLDALKGFIPAYVFPLLSRHVAQEYGILFGILAIIGHNWPIYLKFKGGKGVATSAGMLLGVAPLAVLVGFVCWVLCMAFTRIVSLSSIVAATKVTVAVWVRIRSALAANVALTILAMLVIWLHRANIRRLLNGTENRFGKKKESSV